MTSKDAECDSYLLWIDGVGTWQVCAGNRCQIGAPSQEIAPADICVMAQISRRHATFERIEENWFIRPHAATVISGVPISDRSLLRSGDEIVLADRVRLGFRIPNVLSGSAVIDFQSHHRPPRAVDGIILMSDSCLMGPRADHHICCPDWTEQIALFRQNGQLRCRSGMRLKFDGTQVSESGVLRDGTVVSGEELRFRVEGSVRRIH